MRYKLSLFALAAATLAAACKKDETRTVMQNSVAPTLTASATTLVLAKKDAAKEAVVFSWTPADYGFKAGVKYALQFDVKGNNFSKAQTVNIDSGLKKPFTVAELNEMAGKIKLSPGEPGQVEVRATSDINPKVAVLQSAPVALTVTPYEAAFYLLGSYPGGGEVKTAQKIVPVSAQDDASLMGYIFLPDASTTFKFKDVSVADAVYGDAGDGTSGRLKPGGADIRITGKGNYQLKASLHDNTWSYLKVEWGLVGSATGSWDIDQPMTFDETKKIWFIELKLAAGLVKFRANRSWTINYGDDGADHVLDAGGKDITVDEAGNYRVELDLSPGNFTYSITKK